MRGRHDLAAAYGQIACALWVCDAAGSLIYVNPAAAELFHVGRGETAQSLGWTICDEAGEALDRTAFPSVAAFRTGQAQRRRVIGIRGENRAEQWVMIDALPIFDAVGDVQEVIGTATDITDLKQAEMALRASEERYRRMVETTHEGLCLVDLRSRVTYVNSRLCEMLGSEPEELLGRRSYELFGKQTGTVLADGAQCCGISSRDVPLRRRDGTTLWAMLSAAPMIDDGGRPSGMLTMVSDVTERKRSQARERAAAEQIERLTADAIYTIDEDGRLRSWNNGAERLFGWSQLEVIGRELAMVPPELVKRATEDMKRIVERGETLTRETVRLDKNGQRIDVLGSWSRVQLDDGRTGVLCILKDVSEHKAAHTQLREQAKALALLRERERIAMDLHDGVIQALYGVALSLGALRRKSSDTTSDGAVLGNAIKQLTDTIQGIRDYIYELRTGIAEGNDLEAALRARVEELARATSVTPRLLIEGNVRDIDVEKTHHLMYICHEALSNVARHSGATTVTVRLVRTDDGLSLSITDDGRGFDASATGRRLGDGMSNMRERATLLGATLTIHSQPGAGTSVQVRLA